MEDPVREHRPRWHRPARPSRRHLREALLVLELQDAAEKVHGELIDVLHGPPLRLVLLLGAVPRDVPRLATAVTEAILERHPGASARGCEVTGAAVAALDVACAAASRSAFRPAFASTLAAVPATALACALAEAEVHGHHRLLVGLALAVAVAGVVIIRRPLMLHLDVVDVHGLALQEDHIVGDLLDVLGELVEVHAGRGRVPHQLLTEALGQRLQEVLLHLLGLRDDAVGRLVVAHDLLEAVDAEGNLL